MDILDERQQTLYSYSYSTLHSPDVQTTYYIWYKYINTSKDEVEVGVDQPASYFYVLYVCIIYYFCIM